MNLARCRGISAFDILNRHMVSGVHSYKSETLVQYCLPSIGLPKNTPMGRLAD